MNPSQELEHSLHRCYTCHRQYKRPEHLRRHIASHDDSSRRSRCTACGGSFSRTDALKRHLRTCTGSVRDLPKPRKRRACDRCVQTKKACDFDQPCNTCLERGTICLYTADPQKDGLQVHGAVHNKNLNFAPGTMLAVSATPEDPMLWTHLNEDLFDLAETSWNEFLCLFPSDGWDGNRTEGFDLSFLDNFTKQTGLVNSFDCGETDLRQEFLREATESSQSADEYDNIYGRCAEIVHLIQLVTTIKARNSSVDLDWSSRIKDICSKFFAPSDVSRLIEMYWSIWHPNVNILHRPTLRLNLIKPALLAAMAVIGAAVSPNSKDVSDARMWFNSVEELVFTDDDLCKLDKDDMGQPSVAVIQALQAGYIVCLYQNWEGTDAAKRRIRRHRFNTLVSAIRDAGLYNAKHIECSTLDAFDWHEFAAREQFIRTIIWIFLLDTAFVIFNNLPPRMVIKEMDIHPACNERVFQASSSEECFRALATSVYKKSPSFHEMAKTLCTQDLDDDTILVLSDLGPLNLFAITSSIHSMLFHYQNGFSAESQLGPLRNALDNWKLVWMKYRQQDAILNDHNPLRGIDINTANMWKRVGFIKHASDYWLLASLILDRICVSERTLTSAGEPNTEAAKLTSLPTVQNYDETSMRQVNDLIAGLRKVDLSAV